jgi:hypothetical protein
MPNKLSESKLWCAVIMPEECQRRNNTVYRIAKNYDGIAVVQPTMQSKIIYFCAKVVKHVG